MNMLALFHTDSVSILQCLNMSLTPEFSCIQIQQGHLDLGPEMETIFNTLALRRCACGAKTISACCPLTA